MCGGLWWWGRLWLQSLYLGICGEYSINFGGFTYICDVKELRRHILSISLLLLFTAYLGCIVGSYHVDVVGGELVAHAHPRQGKPFAEEQHSAPELVVIHQFSQIVVLGSILFEVEIGAKLGKGILFLVPEDEDILNFVPSCLYLRGPPSVA